MENKLKLPVGIESFEEIRRNQYYYVDKTKLIEQLFDNLGKVSLFTRPRRFGKTLNMSMLKCFLGLEQIQRFLMDSMFLKIMHFVSSTWGNIPSSFSPSKMWKG